MQQDIHDLQSASPAGDGFAAVLARLGGDVDLDRLARDTKALVRLRVLRSGADLLRLGLAWGPGGRSLQEVAALAGMMIGAGLSDEALIQRLHKAVGQTPWPGRFLRIADATTISAPASKGTDWRIHGLYDLAAGRFTHLELTDKHGAEAFDRGAPVPGEIRIGDRGLASPKAWHRLREASAGASFDFIARLR